MLNWHSQFFFLLTLVFKIVYHMLRKELLFGGCMYFIIFVVLVFALGFFAKLDKEKRFSFGYALVLVVLSTIFASIMFVLTIAGANYIAEQTINDNLFMFMLIDDLLIGVLLYWIYRYLIKKLKIKKIVVSLSEYIVQWGLIYITIQQIVFDNYIKDQVKIPTNGVEIINPNDVIIFILPSLIAVWVALILYKVKIKEIQ